MKRIWEWLLLALAVAQFMTVALPPGMDDLISVQSLALDLSHGDVSHLYPGKDFVRNDEWVAHHTQNLTKLGATCEPNWCFYPPLIPRLLAPLASLPANTWRMIWGAVNIALIAVFVFQIFKLLIHIGAHPHWPLVFALVLGSYPVARAVHLGQTSLLMAVLLWWGIVAGGRRKKWIQAVAIGSAVFVKPFLAVVELADVRHRRYKMVMGVFAIFLAWLALSLLWVGWSAHIEYAHLLSALGRSSTAYSGNQSLLAGVLRLTTSHLVTDYGFLMEPLWTGMGRGLAIIILGLAGWAQWRSKRDDPMLSAGLWLSAAALSLPISWEHHLLFLLPCMAYLWVTTRRTIEMAGVAAATVLMGVCFTGLYSDYGLGRLAACFPLFGNLIFFAILLRRHFISETPETESVQSRGSCPV